MPATARKQTAPNREIVIERWIRAPRHLVWKAFMQPGHIEEWWGPGRFYHDDP